ncbi:MAG: TRAP transporter large permease subunit [Chloroflexota bacterium]
MEWQWAALLIFGTFLFAMTIGIPIAFAFMIINVIGVYLFWGGEPGLRQLIFSLYQSVASFTFLPLPLFILMGEILFHSGVAIRTIDTIDRWLGRMPGRLGLLAVASGTGLSVLTGSSSASTAVLGSVLVPDMEKRGYKKPMSLGPILGSGGLAVMIPPSTLAVLLASLADISVAEVLIGGIVPGLMMSALYSAYIVTRCRLQPSIAPTYEAPPAPLSEKLMASVKYILPLGLIVFLVTGVIFLGVATPSEAAATGCFGSFIVAVAYKGMKWEVMKKIFTSTIEIVVMLLMIIASAVAFSQILAFSGASAGMVTFVMGIPLPPIGIIIVTQLILLVLGMFVDVVPMMMITIPIYMPIVHTLGFNPVWFGILMLLNMVMGMITPPFGIGLFVMKGVAPRDTTIGDIYRASLPFVYCDLVVLALLIAFPSLVLWLPGLIRG